MKTKEIYLRDIKQGDKIASTFLAAEKNMAFFPERRSLFKRASER